jgi:hypothetical protein
MVPVATDILQHVAFCLQLEFCPWITFPVEAHWIRGPVFLCPAPFLVGCASFPCQEHSFLEQ